MAARTRPSSSGSADEMGKHLARDRCLQGAAGRVVGLDDPRPRPRQLAGGSVQRRRHGRRAGSPARCCGRRPQPGRRAPRAAARRRRRSRRPLGMPAPRSCPADAVARRTWTTWRSVPVRVDGAPRRRSEGRPSRPASRSSAARDTARPAASATAGSRSAGDGVSARRRLKSGRAPRRAAPARRTPAGWRAGRPDAAAAGRPAPPARWPAGRARSRWSGCRTSVADDHDERRVADRREGRAHRQHDGAVDDHLDVVEPVAQHGDREQDRQQEVGRRTAGG